MPSPLLPPRNELEAVELRLKTILPETYQDRYEEVQPVSMGTAPLKYGDDGRVAWDDVWGSFCDLAMAGGPPHKGKLLVPGSVEEIAMEPERYDAVVAEICRGIGLVANLKATASPALGWVRVDCLDQTYAQWLVRAVVMENISARVEGQWLELPAGPAYRVEKEIKNVVTAMAKTAHYWDGHMWRAQRSEIARIFQALNEQGPLLQPDLTGGGLAEDVAAGVAEGTGLIPRPDRAVAGWYAFGCPSVRSAIWMMRVMVVCNVLARREDDLLFVPVNPGLDVDGSVVAAAVRQAHAMARFRGVLGV